MKVLKHLAFALGLVAVPASAEDLVVFAAASLKGPLDQIASGFDDVRISYGGSGTLARQVQRGAPADVVLLANEAWMDVLAADGQVAAPVAFVSNRLVLVGQADSPPVFLEAEPMLAALDGGRLAMGFTAAVPAGIYGKAALEQLGLWAALRDQLAEVENVRAALALVARGEAPLGLVYQSDALIVPDLAIVARVPPDSHPQIVYTGAVTAQSTHPQSDVFLQALLAADGQQAFIDAGFCPLAGACSE